MARPLRIEFPGAVYHVTARGNEKKTIFRNDRDKENFLDNLSLVVERFDWLCHAYCLMDNHYHLLIETPKGNLCRGMMQLNGVYAQHFNRKHNRVGHLFQGRYKAILVEKEAYLLELSRYIVLNPVKAGFVKMAEEWPWSSFPATIKKTEKPELLTTGWILGQFGANIKVAIESYKAYVLSGMGVDYPDEELVGQLILGSEKFLNEINHGISDKRLAELIEFPREQRSTSEPTLDVIFEKEMRAGKTRDEVIYSTYYDYNFTQKEIAEYLELHYTTICRVIKRFERGNKNRD